MRYEAMERMLSDRGAVIYRDRFVYRLAVGPNGKARVCKNRLVHGEPNTIDGPAVEVKEYAAPDDAIAEFERLKNCVGCKWQKDDRFLYARGY